MGVLNFHRGDLKSFDLDLKGQSLIGEFRRCVDLVLLELLQDELF